VEVVDGGEEVVGVVGRGCGAAVVDVRGTVGAGRVVDGSTVVGESSVVEVGPGPPICAPTCQAAPDAIAKSVAVATTSACQRRIPPWVPRLTDAAAYGLPRVPSRTG
jgi:hypothetical protein